MSKCSKSFTVYFAILLVFMSHAYSNILTPGVFEYMGDDLSNTSLPGATITPDFHSFASSNWTGSDLSGVTVSTANGATHSFNSANFTNVNFSGAQLFGAHHTYNGANFTNADLSNALLSGNDWTFANTNFTNANLTGATIVAPSFGFYQVTLDDADFSGADISGITGSFSNLGAGYSLASSPFYDAMTLFPTGFDPVAAGWRLQGSSPVPEPSSSMLAMLGLGGLLLSRRRSIKS